MLVCGGSYNRLITLNEALVAAAAGSGLGHRARAQQRRKHLERRQASRRRNVNQSFFLVVPFGAEPD
jgi:hypothetical protein